MARIRTVKPEFWEDEKVGALSPWARLLFVGSWNLADDEGLLRWTPDYLNASLFMYDNLTFPRVQKLMSELTIGHLVFPYTGGTSQQKLSYIVNFRRHQRINRPQPSKFPPPSLQSAAVKAMYAERDGWRCHLCGEALISHELAQEIGGETLATWQPASPDHLIPRAQGGSDYPSNIGAAHVSCNKQRRNGSLPDSSPHSVNVAVNDSPPTHGTTHPLKGREREGKGKEGERVGNGSPPAARCPDHIGVTNPPPCRACGDARRAYDATLRADKSRPTTVGLPPAADAPRCEEPGHEHELASNCRICAADALEGPPDISPEKEGTT